MYLLITGRDLKIERMLDENNNTVIEIFLADTAELQVGKNVKIVQGFLDDVLAIRAEKETRKKNE